MSHAALVWANLRRRPLQSLLGFASATLAFAIYGVMFGVVASFRLASIQNATFEQQLLTASIVLSGAGMALILLLTASAMAHSVRLRLHEFGVLKALGFSHRRIIALVIAEAAAPCVAGAALGLVAVPVLFAVLAPWLPPLATLPAPTYTFTTLTVALLISMLIPSFASVLPAWRIVRLDAAAALTGSAEAPAPVRLGETHVYQETGAVSPPGGRQFLAHAGAIAGLLRQILVVTRIGCSTLPQRGRSAVLMVAGVACMTFVLLWFLSMAEGIRGALLQSGDPARVVVKSDSAAWSLSFSRIPERVAALVAGAPGVARAKDGSPLAEAMIEAAIGPLDRRNGRHTGIAILGVGPHWREMTPSFRLLSGRLPTPGTNEVMVGRLAPRGLLGLDGGPLKRNLRMNQKSLPGVEWQVVGTFTTGDWHDGHVIADIASLKPYVTDSSVTAVLVRLDSPRSFDAFRNAVARQLPPSVTVELEADTYAAIWKAIPKTLLYVAYVLGALLGAGATVATMQVAHSAMESRRREIATLRVLGFDGRAAAASILAEAISFALLGAMIGAGLVWMLRRGDVWAGAGSVFEIGVDLHLVLVATGCAVTIAMIGTLPLAVKSLRRGEMDGLRDLREIEEQMLPGHHGAGWGAISTGMLPCYRHGFISSGMHA